MRVLIVDDDGFWADMLKRRLESAREPKLDVSIATTVDEALRVNSAAGEPFDVYLMDQDLKPGDGIDLLIQLRKTSPDTDAIVITGNDELDVLKRAFEAGVYRFLPKPFKAQELILMLHALEHHRHMQFERNWLRVLAEVTERIQRCVEVKAVGDEITRGAQALGFERARLWLYSEAEPCLVGLSEQGNVGLAAFEGLRMRPDELPYSQLALTERQPQFYNGRNLGTSELDRRFHDLGFQPPVGEWAELPLTAGVRLVGSLALDNAARPQTLTAQQRELLALFGNHAAAALDAARAHQNESRRARDWQVLSTIGKEIATRAAMVSLDALLDAVREHIRPHMDVRNFMVVLGEEETGHLDFRRKYEKDKLCGRYWRPKDAGLVGHVLKENRVVWLPSNIEGYCAGQGIQRLGKRAKCWLGAPLRVGNRAIGALVVQCYDQTGAYTEEHKQLLEAVADQIAGAIETARLAELESDATKQLATLQSLSRELLELVEEKEEYFWHAVLTALTMRDGLSFNRAVLFLLREGGDQLQGRMGVGYFSKQSAHASWEHDRERNFTPQDYVADLRAGKLKGTPVDRDTRRLAFPRGEQARAFEEVLMKQERMIIPAAEALERLPLMFGHLFGAHEYALMPLRIGKTIVGLVVLDNAHDGEPVRPRYLDRAETFLAQVALIYEHRQHQNALETMLATSGGEPTTKRATLNSVLADICRASATFMKADSVIIYPLRPDTASRIYDEDNITGIGLRAELPRTKDKTRYRGVAASVLTSGTLVVPDVDASKLRFRDIPLAEHKFVVRQGIKAFIGVPIRDPRTNGDLGALFLNYRATRSFSARDQHVAELLARLAASGILNYRHSADLAEAALAGEISQRELEALHRVLESSLQAAPERERVIATLINAGAELLDCPSTQLSIGLRHWSAGPSPDAEPSEVRLELSLDDNAQPQQRIVQDLYRGLSGQALATGEPQFVPDPHRSGRRRSGESKDAICEVAIPLKLGLDVSGVLTAFTQEANGLDRSHVQRLQRLASAAALALDNVQRHEHLRAVLDAAKAVTAPTDLKATLDEVVRAVQRAAPGISCISLWYLERQDEEALVPARQWGVRKKENIHSIAVDGTSTPARVMHSPEPIWADSVTDEPRLHGSFVTSEGIASSAAFPLVSGAEPVGALFCHYRRPHQFTPEERTLLPILAEIAATSIRDAQLLDDAKQNARRLSLALDVANVVGAELELDEVLRAIIRHLNELFSGNLTYVQIYDEATRELVFTPASLEVYEIDNPEYAGATRMAIDEGKSITVRVAKASLDTGIVQSTIVNDVRSAQDYIPHRKETKSELCVGLMHGPRLLGTLAMESSQFNAFKPDDEKLIKVIGRQVALAIDRADRAGRMRRTDMIAGAGVWAAELLHEFNREILTIRNNAYWLTETEELSSQAVEYANKIDQGAAKLVEKIRDAWTMGESADDTFSPDSLLVDRVSAWVTERAPDVRVELDLNCAAIGVLGWQEQFWIAVRHILRNAIRAMDKHGLVRVTSRLIASETIEIAIADSGPGIPSRYHSVILHQPFTYTSGKGYGLLLAQYFIERMGGTLRLSPYQANAGAEFVISLPRARTETGGNRGS